MRLLLFYLLCPLISVAQSLNYLPSLHLNKVVDQYYYNTEYIYIENTTENSLNLTYKLVDVEVEDDWSVTLCTNAQCYNFLSESGSLGTVMPGEKAFMSINLSANQTIGEGKIRYAISSLDGKTVNDTITFEYTVTESGKEIAGPWATITFNQDNLTVFLGQTALESYIQVYNIRGKLIIDSSLQTISSFSFRSQPSGVYIVRVRDENDRVIVRKLAHY